jgi:hypothetical protein
MKRLLILISVLALAVTGVAGAATKGKKTSGIAYAGATHVEGSDLYVSGDVKDKLLGRGGIVYVTRVTQGQQSGTYNVEAKKITIYFPNGTLTGKGSAVQTIHDDGTADVADGKFNLTTGTGKLKGHSLKGTFGGPENSSGVYKFSYKGVLK